MKLNAPTYLLIGDIPFAVWELEMSRYPSSPLIPVARNLYEITKGHTALALAHMKRESSFETDRLLLSPSDHNEFNLKVNGSERPAGMTGTKPEAHLIDGDPYLTFDSFENCAREWVRRITDSTYVRVRWVNGVRREYRYRPDMTLKEYSDTFAEPGDAHPTTGDANETYADDMVTMLTRFAATERELTMAETITYGKVPMFGYIDKYLKNKREGFGWDNLGQRRPKFIALHRMLGSMASTLSHFSNPNVSSITDYAIGVEATDGKAMAGVIYRYNDPLGFRSGWASGPVSAPFGDGKAFVDKYGINAVNRDGISIEISGFQNTPVDAEAWKELVHFCAFWCDYMNIPYASLPINPATGISAFIWHTEFTAGTGKECPFKWMRDNTDRLISDVTVFLKKYQTASDLPDVEEPEVPTIPKPTYATPVPVPALAALGAGALNANTARHVSIDNANEFVFVGDRVRAVRDTKRLQFATKDAKEVGPVIKAGEEFDVLWSFRAQDGTYYYLTPWWTRVAMADTERISDAIAA